MSQFNALRRQSVAQRTRKSVVDDPRNLQRILQAELQDYTTDKIDINDPEFKKRIRIRKLRKIAKVVDTLSFVLATVGVIFATVDYELYYDDTNKPHFTRQSDGEALLTIVSLTTAVLMITMIIHSVITFKLEKLRNPLYRNVTYLRSRYSKQLIVEIIICGVHCPPYIDRTYNLNQLNFQFTYSLSGILLNCMFARFYLFFRIFATYSLWTSEMAQESCEPEGCQADTMFAMKAVLKERPYTALLLLMGTTTVVFGLMVRNFERPVYYNMDPNSSEYQDYGFIWNGMWLIAITMTTVGYGDYYPRTNYGRLVAVAVSFWGVFLVSMMVVTLTGSSSFEPKEAKAYDILFRLNTKDEIKKKAASVITTVVRIVGNNKKLKAQKITKAQHKTDHLIYNNELTIKLEVFRNAKSLLSDYEISPEELLRQLSEKIDRDFEDLKDLLLSMVSLEKHLSEIEKSQNLVFSALNDTTTFTSNLQNQLIQL